MNASKPTVYVRPVALADLPKEVQSQITVASDIFAIHNADGDCIGLAPSRSLAFHFARTKDLSPVSVH